MDYRELATESFSTLRLNKVRTGLAMLGVIIGIGSVIALISLGQASQLSVENQIKSLGSNLLTVNPGSRTTEGIRGPQGGVTTLTYADAQAILSSSSVTTVKSVSAEYSQRAQVVAGRNNTNTQIIGTTPSYASIHNLNINSGTFLNQIQLASASRVAVLGPQTAADLYNSTTGILGNTLRISGQVFTVIGIIESKGGVGFQNQDDRIYIPLSTAQNLVFGVDYVNSISIEANRAQDMALAQNQVGYLLLQRHKISDPAQADFSIFSQEDLLGTISQVTGTFTTLLSGIAAISLVVGGIGIMNIMLVTVTERTREIGLRKAVGAKKRVIIIQFLMEAVIITFIGGVVGVFIGSFVSFILTRTMDLPFTISLVSVLLAFGVSAITGIVFGWYPSRKAANLQPIEALRYE
jgi:putative ABC transport system permease protein